MALSPLALHELWLSLSAQTLGIQVLMSNMETAILIVLLLTCHIILTPIVASPLMSILQQVGGHI